MIHVYKIFTCTLLIAFLAHSGYAQVGEVQKKSKQNQENKKSGRREGGGGNSGVFFDLFFQVTLNGLIEAQTQQLQRKEDEPWLVSFEGMLYSGYSPKNNNILYQPAIRGNWGLFSSSLRYNRMVDETGNFETIDWQTFILNVVNRPKATFRIGTGLSWDQEVHDAYFEHFLGLDLHFNERQVNPTTEIRVSKDYGTGATPRFEWNTRVDFNFRNVGKLHINPMVGVIYQRYFSSVDFFFFQFGLRMSLY